MDLAIKASFSPEFQRAQAYHLATNKT